LPTAFIGSSRVPLENGSNGMQISQSEQNTLNGWSMGSFVCGLMRLGVTKNNRDGGGGCTR
jgi:hypothetical protein